VEAIIRVFRFPSDYDDAVSLWASAGEGVSVGRSDAREEIAKKAARDPDLFLVAEKAGSIIGTVIGGFDGRRGFVYHLAVAPAARSRGLGSLLMDEVERRLCEKGCLRVYLLVTNENNAALRFYEKRGWAAMDLRILAKNLA